MTRYVHRYKRPPGKLIHIVIRLLAALALSTTLAVAQKTVPQDRVYELHSEAQGSCPSMNWHMLASPDGVLTGMVAWDNRKVVAMVTGTIMPLVQVERFRQAARRQPAVSDIPGDRHGCGGSEARRQYQWNHRAKRLA